MTDLHFRSLQKDINWICFYGFIEPRHVEQVRRVAKFFASLVGDRPASVSLTAESLTDGVDIECLADFPEGGRYTYLVCGTNRSLYCSRGSR